MSIHLNLKIKQLLIGNIVDKLSSSEITHIMNNIKKIMPKKITRCIIFLIFLFIFFKFNIILINFNSQ